MNRREALKRMGMTVAGAAVMLSGIPTLSSCKKEKKRIVFYFTATGNCLYVARQLSKEIVSIPQAFKQNRLTYEADEIGIVAPTYEGAPPEMVKKFLQNSYKCYVSGTYRSAVSKQYQNLIVLSENHAREHHLEHFTDLCLRKVLIAVVLVLCYEAHVVIVRGSCCTFHRALERKVAFLSYDKHIDVAKDNIFKTTL